jgi:purine nucleosidase
MRKIIIDCDPGVDDALAIFLALASSAEIDVLGITCVKGNVALEKTYANARRICAEAKRLNIPVLRGASRPFIEVPLIEGSVHGVDGLGDIGLPEAPPPNSSQHAVSFIIEQASRFPGEVVLCPIGPMTNVALALMMDDGLAGKLHSIVFMGGAAYVPGNMNAHAEFNFMADPQAAQIMMGAKTPMVMFGLDVTHKATIVPRHLEGLRANGNNCSLVSARLLSAYAVGDLHLHDPCVIAWLIDPTLFTGIQSDVDVVIDPGPELGRSRAKPSAKGNCLVMRDVDHSRLFDLLLSRIKLLP